MQCSGSNLSLSPVSQRQLIYFTMRRHGRVLMGNGGVSSSPMSGTSMSLNRFFGAAVTTALLVVLLSFLNVLGSSNRLGERPELLRAIVDLKYENPKSGRCLSLKPNGGMDRLLGRYEQVFLVMPAKAAGTTFKLFTQRCMDSAGTPSFAQRDNPLNFKELMTAAFKAQMKLPSLVTSHLYNETHFESLIKHATRDTLIIYTHREETSRLKSGIKQFIAREICKYKETFDVANDGCQVTEHKVMEATVGFYHEIGVGAVQLLTCGTFEAIKENAPNFAFVHYKQARKLVTMLKKHHCPGINTDDRSTGATNDIISVELESPEANGASTVSFDDWMKAKSNFLEYVLSMKDKMSCQATTRDIEEELYACPDEALQISGRSYGNEKILFPL